MPGRLFLIPTTLGDSSIDDVIPDKVIGRVKKLSCFIVENERSARRFLLRMGIITPIDQIQFMVLNKNTPRKERESFLNPAVKSQDIGIISEAGVPGVADPGADIVLLAHKKGIPVIPLVGPSSILLALMGSGLNGQHFTFHGYLPVHQKERIRRIKELENKSINDSGSQIFMETPYRNQKLYTDIIRSCHPETYLCLATDLTLETESIQTRSISEWERNVPDIHKRPTIFIIQG
jgi:16S rRNA (cytidine1402-2'-O)-methyltransferase